MLQEGVERKLMASEDDPRFLRVAAAVVEIVKKKKIAPYRPAQLPESGGERNVMPSDPPGKGCAVSAKFNKERKLREQTTNDISSDEDEDDDSSLTRTRRKTKKVCLWCHLVV